MKIVHVEDSFDPSAGYQINELLKMQKDNLEQVVISSLDLSAFHKVLNVNEDREFEKENNIRIIRLKVIIKLSSRMILKDLWKTIKTEKPDILFLHGIADFKDLLLFFKKKRHIVVRDCHMSWIASRNPFAKYFIKIYSVIFSPIINTTNKYVKIYALGVEELVYLKKLGVKNEKIEMLLHGYNKQNFYFDKEERFSLRKEMGIEAESILISYIGKLDTYKRPDLIFDILALLAKRFKQKNQIKLLFVGSQDIDYMQKVFIPKMNNSFIKKDVQILPSKAFKKLKGYYSASDICIWPKQTTLSSIHAQVCKTKVIMENYESNKERVIDNSALFNPNNLEEAKNILIRIIENKEYVKNFTSELDIQILNREYSNQFVKLISVLNL